MNLGLDGKWGVVTGASRGLGYACARALMQERCNVWIGSRDSESLVKTATQLQKESNSKVQWFPLDFTKPESISGFVGHIQKDSLPVQAVVVSGGGPVAGPILKLGDEDWRQAYQLVVVGPVQLVRELEPILSTGSSIVFIGAAGFKSPLQNSVLSNAMRASLAVVVKILSQELGEKGVRVNAVLPGPFATERTLELASSWASQRGISIEEAVASRYLRKLDTDHLGDPSELGQLVAFLSSPRAAYIAGTCITIDGGFSKTLL